LAANKAATSRRTPQQAVSSLPYTDVKTDLVSWCLSGKGFTHLQTALVRQEFMLDQERL